MFLAQPIEPKFTVLHTSGRNLSRVPDQGAALIVRLCRKLVCLFRQSFSPKCPSSCFPGFLCSLVSSLPDTFLKPPSTVSPFQRYLQTPCYVSQILHDPFKSAADSRFGTPREVNESFSRMLSSLSRECLSDPDPTRVLR